MRGRPGTTPGCGTLARYRAGCRCGRCRAANARQSNVRRLRAARGLPVTMPRHGTIRRLQALRALGWPMQVLGARLGVTEEALHDLCRRLDAPIQVDTAVRITALYDELSMTLGPSDATRRYAARKGWAPPLCWDDDALDDPAGRPAGHMDRAARRDDDPLIDEAAVQRRADGDHHVPLTRAERLELVRRLHGYGFNDQEIADRTGYTDRTILRIRIALQLAANPTKWSTDRTAGAA